MISRKTFAACVGLALTVLMAACGHARHQEASLTPAQAALEGVVVPRGFTPILVTLHHDAARESAAVRSFGRNYNAPLKYSSTLLVRRQVKDIARQYHLREERGWLINSLSIYCVLLGVPDDMPVSQVMAQLRTDKRVESVQQMVSYSVQSAPYNDPYFELQYEHGRDQIASLHREATGKG
ncbi:MAG: hypothetical protein OIF34_03485, partial [Porticoccaceae bacterium]|nr:hypothetical protein [Porticoccaceae bacterium]